MRKPVPRTVEPDPETELLTLVWSDGLRAEIPYRSLREQCPCARCRTTRESGAELLIMAMSTRLQSWSRVGNYALNFEWGDSHREGIFSYELLRNMP